MTIPDFLLQAWKFVLLGFMYLFFLRVLRAVWANLRASTAPLGVSGSQSAATQSSTGKPTKRDPKGLNQLKVVEPPEDKGTVYELADEITIGRAQGCLISLDDTFVSQLHARVYRRDKKVILEDLGSTNGTLCNGKRVSTPVTLRKGDRIQVGKTVMEAQR